MHSSGRAKGSLFPVKQSILFTHNLHLSLAVRAARLPSALQCLLAGGEMWGSAARRRRGKGSNEAGEMYVWLPISNIYEERALRRGGQGKGRRGGQKGYSVMPALKNGQTRRATEGRGWAGGRYTCRICIFNIFCLGGSTSSAASQPLSTVCMEWYCQASRGRGKVRKVPILFTESCRASNFC